MVPGTAGSEMSTSLEQEKYFSAIVSLTPMGNQRFPGGGTLRTAGPLAATSSNHSLTSIDSLLLCHAVAGDLLLGGAGGELAPGEATKLRGRFSGASPLARAVSNLRSGGVKAKCKHPTGARLPASPPPVLCSSIISGGSTSQFCIEILGNYCLTKFGPV